MKKIALSLAMIVVVGAVAIGATRAYFSNQVPLTGITFSTGNADLQVWNGSSYVDSWFVNQSLSGLYPGYQTSFTATFFNNSSSDISLNPSAILTSATGDWDALKDVVQIRVYGNGGDTGFQTLNTWYSSNQNFGGSSIAKGATAAYTVQIFVPSSFGNEIANKTIQNVVFTVTGTQSP